MDGSSPFSRHNFLRKAPISLQAGFFLMKILASIELEKNVERCPSADFINGSVICSLEEETQQEIIQKIDIIAAKISDEGVAAAERRHRRAEEEMEQARNRELLFQNDC